MRLTFFSFPFLVRFILFFGALYALGEGRLSLILLIICAFFLALIHQILSRGSTQHLHLANVVRFVPFFLYHSFLGALGVAKLALRPRIVLSPCYYTLTLHGSPSTNAITANIFSLMPGTLSVEIRPRSLTLHILDNSLFDEALIHQTHQKLESLFYVSQEGS